MTELQSNNSEGRFAVRIENLFVVSEIIGLYQKQINIRAIGVCRIATKMSADSLLLVFIVKT